MPEKEYDAGNELLFSYLRQIIYEPEKAELAMEKLPVSMQRLGAGLDLLRDFVLEARLFGSDLANGRIWDARMPSRENVLAGPLKSVHGMLQHLIWLMNEVTTGDYVQRMSLTNDLSVAFNTMVEMLLELSLQDRLTGLLNVNGFDEKAAKLLREYPQEPFWVLSIDIHDFKHVNSLYGTQQGDAMLLQVAKLLRTACRENELCARVHADEFVCLIHEKDAAAAAARFDFKDAGFRTLLITQENLFRRGFYPVTDHLVSLRQMRQYAVFAARHSQQGEEPDAYMVFDEKLMHRYTVENTMLENFEAARFNEEFKIWYQPKVDAKSGRIASCEALVRWESGKGNILMPGEFIELFEHNGLITVLDFHLLDRICAELRNRMAARKPVVPVAVNFSRVHLLDRNFVGELLRILARHQIKPEWIEIEITENAFFEDRELMQFMLKQLHNEGFRIAMDDFGSGFSSLNFLRTLPIDVLKIDKLFLEDFATDRRSRLLLQDILSIAEHFGLQTVLEGVETKEEVGFLRGCGCDLFQGFYFYRPLRSLEFWRVLSEEQEKREKQII